MKIAFSISNITTLVYAHAALDRANGEDLSFIEILSPDRSEALAKVIKGCLAELILKLAPAIIGADLDSLTDIVEMTFAEGTVPEPMASATRVALERWAALNALAVIHMAEERGAAAARYSDLAALALTNATTILEAAAMTGTVTPCNY